MLEGSLRIIKSIGLLRKYHRYFSLHHGKIRGTIINDHVYLSCSTSLILASPLDSCDFLPILYSVKSPRPLPPGFIH